MLPDLDSLSLFVRAAELRNLGRAAEAGFITSPAASRRLALLEHQFGAQLFERHSRGLQLTPAGERLLLLARDVLSKVHHMRAEMGNYASGKQAVLHVSGNTSAMTQFLLADVASFQTEFPDIRLVVEECWSDDATRRVRSGEVDLGVVVEGCDTTGLWCCPYRRDQLAAVLPADDALANEALSFSDLLDRDLVGLERRSSLMRLLSTQAANLLRPMALRVEVRSFETVCRAVEARLGIGILPMSAAVSFEQSMKLRLVPLRDEWAQRRMLLCARGSPARDTPLGKLVSFLEACVANDTAEAPPGDVARKFSRPLAIARPLREIATPPSPKRTRE